MSVPLVIEDGYGPWGPDTGSGNYYCLKKFSHWLWVVVFPLVYILYLWLSLLGPEDPY